MYTEKDWAASLLTYRPYKSSFSRHLSFVDISVASKVLCAMARVVVYISRWHPSLCKSCYTVTSRVSRHAAAQASSIARSQSIYSNAFRVFCRSGGRCCSVGQLGDFDTGFCTHIQHLSDALAVGTPETFLPYSRYAFLAEVNQKACRVRKRCTRLG